MKKKRPNPYPIDDENPEWTEEMFKRSRPAREVFEELFGAEETERFFEECRRGRPRKEAPEVSTTLRLDADILAALRATGRRRQTRVNRILKDWVEARPQSIFVGY